MEIQFQSRWLERCIRDYLGIENRPITRDDVRIIKYLRVSTTHEYLLEFGKGVLPEKFEFSDAGDEWLCCCLSDTAKYHNIEEFIDIGGWGNIQEISIKGELLEKENSNGQGETLSPAERERRKIEWKQEKKVIAQAMQDFKSSVKIYETCEAKEHAFEGFVWNEGGMYEWDHGILFPEDFAHFTNLEVVRLMGCEREIHSLAFLKMLSRLRVLEVGEVRLGTLDGLEKLRGLEKLCIWPG